MKLISNLAKRITDPIFDVVCDKKLTPGQTLTVLNMAKEVLDQQIADLQETVKRQLANEAEAPTLEAAQSAAWQHWSERIGGAITKGSDDE